MAGKSEGTGALYKGKHFSRKDKMRQNDNHITGETWKVIPNTDFAYYSSLGRFCTSHNVDFPYNGAYLCTEDELRSEVQNQVCFYCSLNQISKRSKHKFI